MSSVSSSVSDEINPVTDTDLFVLAGQMAKLLADNTKTASNRKKVLGQLATFYNMKLVPINTISQGSNQVLNHLSGSLNRLNMNAPSAKDYSPKTQKGQPPPNPIKRDPEYMKMSSEHLKAINELKPLIKGSNEHSEKLKHVRSLEDAMAKFKRERGRVVQSPAESQGITPSAEQKASSAN